MLGKARGRCPTWFARGQIGTAQDLDGDPVYWNRPEPKFQREEDFGVRVCSLRFQDGPWQHGFPGAGQDFWVLALKNGLQWLPQLRLVEVPTEFLIQHEVYTITRIMQVRSTRSHDSACWVPCGQRVMHRPWKKLPALAAGRQQPRRGGSVTLQS